VSNGVTAKEGRLNKVDTKLPAKSAGRPQPAEQLAFLGPAPLIEGEDAACYDELLAKVSSVVQPSDILEHFWARDVVDLVWEGVRLRRLKAKLMNVAAQEGLEVVLYPLIHNSEAAERTPADQLAEQWAARRPGAIKEVEKLLGSAGRTMDDVMAVALSLKIDDFERIDGLIMTAEARRIAALRELERHRATFAQHLRRTAQDVEGAGHKLIAEKPEGRGPA
jgi:hypothetical protein